MYYFKMTCNNCHASFDIRYYERRRSIKFSCPNCGEPVPPEACELILNTLQNLHDLDLMLSDPTSEWDPPIDLFDFQLYAE